jgi:hypothetical protein
VRVPAVFSIAALQRATVARLSRLFLSPPNFLLYLKWYAPPEDTFPRPQLTRYAPGPAVQSSASSLRSVFICGASRTPVGSFQAGTPTTHFETEPC